MILVQCSLESVIADVRRSRRVLRLDQISSRKYILQISLPGLICKRQCKVLRIKVLKSRDIYNNHVYVACYESLLVGV